MIHYKGESTRKSSLNYVRLFYGAMLIFSRKHFAGKNERLLSLVILPGVYFRAAIAMVYRQLNLFSHSSSWSFFSEIFDRIIHLSSRKNPKRENLSANHVSLIIANYAEARRIKDLLQRELPERDSSSPDTVTNANPDITHRFEFAKRIILLTDLKEKIEQIHPDEIIFSAADLATDQIIVLMCQLRDYSIPFRIAHTEINTIIGSNYVKSYRL